MSMISVTNFHSKYKEKHSKYEKKTPTANTNITHTPNLDRA